MKSKRFAMVIVIAGLLTIFNSISKAKEGPLFQREEPLELILEADLVTIVSDKSEEPEYTTALLIHVLPDNNMKAFEIKVKPRGSTRRMTELCECPPLKFNFKKNHLENTVFEGQDKLKFVSQCRQNEAFENYVLEEYLLYKTYNIITEESYRTRLVNITIKDIKLRVPTISMTGFLIEDDKTVSKRLGAKEYDKMVYSQDSCADSSVDRMSMFQFMIGNTDWYINTKHNTDVFEIKSDKSLIPVPFDFDFSGVINTIYARPSKEIPITSVRQRYYKGSCRDDSSLDATIRLFNEKKSDIYVLYSTFDYLPKSVIKKSLKYYEKFYKIINNPELSEDSFYTACIPIYPSLKAPKNSIP